jgi:hypothetical protein
VSRVYFHFGEGVTLQLLGSERAHLDFVSKNVAFGAIGMVSSSMFGVEDALNGLKPFLGEEYARMDYRDPRTADNLRYAIDSVMSGEKFSYKGRTLESFSLRLNTAIVAGSDPVALAAKIHATCEIYGYFLGKDRAWLADVIEQGLEANIFRRSYWAPRDRNADLRTLMKLPVTDEEAEYIAHSMGWTEIVEQLRKSDQEPVVMSYSVTDSFPYMPEDWQPEEPLREPENDWETRHSIKKEMFYDLPEDEKFKIAFADLEKNGGNQPISPETLRGILFRHEVTLLDLMRNDIPTIEKKLKLNP